MDLGMTTTGGSSSSSSSSDGAAMTSPVSPSIPRRHSLNPAAAAAAQGGGGGGGESPFLRRASVGGALLLAPPPVVDSATVGMGDDSVEQTNDDATLCKKSAVRYGYWRDPYLEHMAPKLTERKPPEIHLGYYTRVTALRRLLDKAMEVCCEKASGGVQVTRNICISFLDWIRTLFFLYRSSTLALASTPCTGASRTTWRRRSSREG